MSLELAAKYRGRKIDLRCLLPAHRFGVIRSIKTGLSKRYLDVGYEERLH